MNIDPTFKMNGFAVSKKHCSCIVSKAFVFNEIPADFVSHWVVTSANVLTELYTIF
jgi:hypothetical protein